MGFGDDIKKSAEAVGEKIERTWEDTTARISDKADEKKAEGDVKRAEADVKRAEAERDSVKARNEFREDLRDS